MDQQFIKQLKELGSIDLVMRKLQERRDEILDAIASRQVEPTPGLMIELAELNIACGDVPEVGHENQQ